MLSNGLSVGWLVVHPVVVLVCFMCACWFVGRLFVCLMGVGVCVCICLGVGCLLDGLIVVFVWFDVLFVGWLVVYVLARLSDARALYRLLVGWYSCFVCLIVVCMNGVWLLLGLLVV